MIVLCKEKGKKVYVVADLNLVLERIKSSITKICPQYKNEPQTFDFNFERISIDGKSMYSVRIHVPKNAIKAIVKHFKMARFKKLDFSRTN